MLLFYIVLWNYIYIMLLNLYVTYKYVLWCTELIVINFVHFFSKT